MKAGVILSNVAPEAGVIARAVGAACALRGLDPAMAWKKGNGRAVRILAGAALKARLGVQATVLAPLLKVEGPELSPSMLTRRGITTDDLLSVAEGLATARPVPPEVTPARPVARAPERRPSAPPVPAPAPARVSAPAPVARPIMAPPQPARVAPAASRPSPERARPVPPRPVVPPAARPAPVVRPAHRTGAVIRLKPVTADIARWARPALACPLWTVDEVAELFGVHPEALTDAVAA